MTADTNPCIEAETDDGTKHLLGGSNAVIRIGATAAAGLVSFGKIFVGAASNTTLVKAVLKGFAAENQGTLDKLRGYLRRSSGVFEAPQRIMEEMLEDIAGQALEHGIHNAAEEHAHPSPIVDLQQW